jgi:hypothetical protein
MSARSTVKREMRVAFSRRGQPVWFRILKWAVLVAVGWLLWRSPYFWWWIAGFFALGLTIHFIWRWKTKRWTRPWFFWDDVEAARDPE